MTHQGAQLPKEELDSPGVGLPERQHMKKVHESYLSCCEQLDQLWQLISGHGGHVCTGHRLDETEEQLATMRTENEMLIGDMARMCEERQKLSDDLDNFQTRKEVDELILDQHYDEIKEHRQAAATKDVVVQGLRAKLEEREAEIATLQNQSLYFESTIAVGEEALARLRYELRVANGELAGYKTYTGNSDGVLLDYSSHKPRNSFAGASCVSGPCILAKHRRRRRRRGRRRRGHHGGD